VVEVELDLDTSEVLILKVVEEISKGTWAVYYHVLSQIEGNADIYKKYIQDNRDIIEANILRAIFGSTLTADQTIVIDDSDSGLVIVTITASPTVLPTNAPTTKPTAMPTRMPTSEPSNLPTLYPTSFPTYSPMVAGSVYQTITWATSLCCLLESQIVSTLTSISTVLSVGPARIDIESYTSARRRSGSETASTWKINYQIYTYTTDDPNLYTDLMSNLENDSVLKAIADNISSNLNVTITSIQTLSLSVEENNMDDRGDITWMIPYAVIIGVALGVFCYCAFKCRRCSKNSVEAAL